MVDMQGPKAGLDRVNEYRRKNTALWSTAEISKIISAGASKAEIAILGDSRGRSLTGSFKRKNSRWVLTEDGDTVVNLSFGGANLLSSLEIFNHFKARLNNLDTVILVLSYEDVFDFKKSDQLDEAIRISNVPIDYFLSLRTLSYYFPDMFFNQLYPGGETVSYTVEKKPLFLKSWGLIESKKLEVVGTGDLANNFKGKALRGAKIVSRKIAKSNGRVAAEGIENLLIPFIKENSSLNIIIVIPPMHPFLENQIMESYSWLHSLITARLSQFAYVYDASLYDEESTVFSFIDSVHINRASDVFYDSLRCFRSDSYASRYEVEGVGPCLGYDQESVLDGLGFIFNRKNPSSSKAIRFNGDKKIDGYLSRTANDLVVSFNLRSYADVKPLENQSLWYKPVPVTIGDLTISQRQRGYRMQIGEHFLLYVGDVKRETQFDIVFMDNVAVFYVDKVILGVLPSAVVGGRINIGDGKRNRYWKGELSYFKVQDKDNVGEKKALFEINTEHR